MTTQYCRVIRLTVRSIQMSCFFCSFLYCVASLVNSCFYLIGANICTFCATKNKHKKIKNGFHMRLLYLPVASRVITRNLQHL